jgi:hypothetical protein
MSAKGATLSCHQRRHFDRTSGVFDFFERHSIDLGGGVLTLADLGTVRLA